VQAGYAIAPADVALWSPASVAAPSRAGRVEAIVIAPEAEAPMVRVDSAVARADRGLEGDRYFDKRGTFSHVHSRGYDLTLIEPRCSTASSSRLAGSRRKRPAETCSPADRPQRARRQAVHHRRGPVSRAAAVRAVRAPQAPDRKRGKARHTASTHPQGRPTRRCTQRRRTPRRRRHHSPLTRAPSRCELESLRYPAVGSATACARGNAGRVRRRGGGRG
jgi:hypothetical protein